MKQNTDTQVSNINNKITIFRRLAWLSVIIGFIAFLMGIYLLVCKNQDFNEVGDFVGGISGSLWALSGLFFIYIAFLGQKIEIKYQQEDLALTRKELEESREVFKAQAEIMSIQQIDNTFFNLLENHRKLIDSLKKGNIKPLSNNSFFNNLSTNSNNIIEEISGNEIIKSITLELKNFFYLHSIYHYNKLIFYYNQELVTPYELVINNSEIKMLYNDLSLIFNYIINEIKENKKEFYFKLATNNISNDEKFIIEAFKYFKKDNNLPIDFDEFTNYEYYNLSLTLPRLDLNFNKIDLWSENKNFNFIYNNYLFNTKSIDKVKVTLFTKKFIIDDYIFDINTEMEFFDIVKELDMVENNSFLSKLIESNKNENIFLLVKFNSNGFDYAISNRLSINKVAQEYFEFRIQDDNIIEDINIRKMLGYIY